MFRRGFFASLGGWLFGATAVAAAGPVEARIGQAVGGCRFVEVFNSRWTVGFRSFVNIEHIQTAYVVNGRMYLTGFNSSGTGTDDLPIAENEPLIQVLRSRGIQGL